ncbi:DUF389 domain-containing protein [Demequina aestuarii]|uniref:DUF389 domain-containing protein n=1 Tax=Demequina aestuarii TaxID=327095 RepID=UPI0007822E5C|nr:DUF389 domain-containing protein [Demequina aestuarii]
MGPRLGGERNTVEHVRSAVFFEGPNAAQKLSRFWILLVLSGVIAAAGVVADSTATVIGAMIVAPMMIPIQGIVVATVLGDRVALGRSVTLVVTGALAAVAIAYLIGLLSVNEIVAATNTQVSARVNPKLIDMLAALGTGVVGSIALVRQDISDTLPGVAIAISLVPPLSVIGVSLESGAYAEAGGAALLFLANVAAILLTGIVVMGVYGVHGPDADAVSARRPRRALLSIIAMVIAIGIPLSVATVASTTAALRIDKVQQVADDWLSGTEWELLGVDAEVDSLRVRVTGQYPAPSSEELAHDLTQAGIDVGGVEVEFVPSTIVDLGALE